MSNKFTLASVVVAHLLVALCLTVAGGCRSTSGFERSAPSKATVSSFSGPGEAGASGPMLVSSKRAQPAPAAPVEEPTAPASPAAAPAPAPAPGAAVEQPAPVAEQPAPAEQPIKPVGAGRTYVVKSGESIWVIARRENVSEADLLAANDLKRNATLRPGQSLVIPAASSRKAPAESTGAAKATNGSAASASGDVYVVKKGDVLSIIARKLGTTTAALREVNGIKGDAIREGQKLRVPAGAKPKASVATAGAKPAAKPVEKTGVAAKAAPAAAPAPTTAAAPAPALIDVPLMGSGAAPAPVSSGAAPAPAPVNATPTSAPAPESDEIIQAR